MLSMLAMLAMSIAGCSEPLESVTPESTDSPIASEPVSSDSAEPAVGRPDQADAHPVRDLTGAPTRIVWVQDPDGQDPFAQGTRLRLMGLDTEDGRGERPLLPDPGSYAKPIITPGGNRVLYSNRPEDAVYLVDWDDGDRRRISAGFGLAVWLDADGHEWAYVGTAYDDSDFPPYAPVYRVRLDDPSIRELAWESPPIAEDNFQLSADGRLASGAYPWPYCGLGDLDSREFSSKAEGCWPDLSPDNSYVLWVFDGSHRNLMMFAPDGGRWNVNINSAPGMDGSEVYHPRWSNHTRIMALTGPYTVGDRANKIRGGGTGVEIHLGRFSRDLTSVERWVQATDNGQADFYPDVWVDPAGAGLAGLALSSAPGAASPSTAATPTRLVVDARLMNPATVPTPDSIAPYRAGLLVNTYRVERVIEGTYDADRIMAAHWVIRDGEVLDTAERARGRLYRMTLEIYDDHPELEGQRLVMDSDDFELELFYDLGMRAAMATP